MKIQGHSTIEPPGPRRLRACALLVIGWALPRALLLALALAWSQCIWAQPKPPVLIGVLTTSWGNIPQVPGIQDGLKALGYREHEHFEFGTRFTSGSLSDLPEAARDLVALGADIIYAQSAAAAMAAKRATSDIPIIFGAVGDPVQTQLVASYARPGGNVTGVADDNTALSAKRLEMFKLLVPRLKKIGFVYDGRTSSATRAKLYRRAAERLGLELVARKARSQAEARNAVNELAGLKVDGFLGTLVLSINIPGLVLEIANRHRIPSMFPGSFWAEQGALASYAPGFYASGRLAAGMMDKIMRGVKPADIPVQVNNTIEFVINLKTAKKLGVKVPPQVLFRADRIIR